MLVADLRSPALPTGVAGDLDRAAVGDDGDHQLLATPAHPDPLINMVVRHRITHPLNADRGVPPHPTGQPKRQGHRLGGQHMQPREFLDQQLGRHPTGGTMRAGIDLLAEVPARLLEFSESGVGVQQISLGGHQIGLGDAHRGLRTTLVCGSAGTQVRIVIP
ncbi:hypothetical protein MGAD_58950 [Mycolicibacterium gadium]|uniref:Uncharacterized protein n=1 Tax=Mycolicibacterium gadium TaxID=1794 RepID=A0A7I7WWR4_MYCGU|nr:hypothetical protein MGAD_58950 [Mycolicibacterium gadium]